MSDQPLATTVSYLIAQICKAHRRHVNAELAALGLHGGQEMLLCQLWQDDGLTQSELVARLDVQPATVSKMLARLEAAQLVNSCRDPRDGRISRIHLTDAGRDLQEPVHRTWDSLETATLANLAAEERVVLRRLLVQVLDNLALDEDG